MTRRLAGPKLLRAFAAVYPEAFFIEIGSNDGEQHDHLRPMILDGGWRGIMVEPVPFVFERLRRNYGRLERVALENVAIADRDGSLPFYHLARADPIREGLPQWYDAIGSFSRESVLGHSEQISDIEARIVQTDVSCLTFESLCRKHGVDRLDVLLIDTEGYDWEIIQRVDFAVHRPRLLIYEHYHLDEGTRDACRAHLERLGYRVKEEGFDSWCLDAREDDLMRTWDRLRPGVPGLSAHDERR